MSAVVFIVLAIYWLYVVALHLAAPVFGSMLAWSAIKAKMPAIAAVGLCCALFPEAYFIIHPNLARRAEERRQAELVKAPRVKLDSNSPRVLIQRSHLTDLEHVVLLRDGGIDEILIVDAFDNGPGRRRAAPSVSVTRVTGGRAPECAQFTLQTWRRGKRDLYGKARDACLSESQENISTADLASRDVLVFSSGRQTSLFNQGGAEVGEAFELRRRAPGRDDLVDYAEAPVVLEQSNPFCLPVAPCLQPVPGRHVDRLQFLVDALKRA